MVATAGDYLRLWRVTDSEVRQECMLNNVCGGIDVSNNLILILISEQEFRVLCTIDFF